MGCCISNIDGLSGGGSSSGGITAPGVVFWTFANDGGPANGIITTTDAVPVFRTWATLPNVGDAVDYFFMFFGHRDNGDDCLFRQSQGGFARNALGSNSLNPVAAVVTSGFDETGTGVAPWNNLVANPAGWGGGVNFLPGGDIIQVAFNGAAGETINWKCLGILIPYFGAVIQV